MMLIVIDRKIIPPLYLSGLKLKLEMLSIITSWKTICTDHLNMSFKSRDHVRAPNSAAHIIFLTAVILQLIHLLPK